VNPFTHHNERGITVIHMTATHGPHFDQWGVTCRCTWGAGPFASKFEAITAGDEHLKHANAPVNRISDTEAMDRLAAYLAQPGYWDSADVALFAQQLVIDTGRPDPDGPLGSPRVLDPEDDVTPRDQAPAAYLAALEARHHAAAKCARCGGQWGQDPTCSTCTHEDGSPRPRPSLRGDELLDLITFALEENRLHMRTDAACVSDIRALMDDRA
jgi:hypothetical protein